MKPSAFTWLFLMLVFLCLCIIPAGIWALRDAPSIPATFSSHDGHVLISYQGPDQSPLRRAAAATEPLISIGQMQIAPEDLLRYPEFFFPGDESRWWSRQRDIYHALKQDRVELAVMRKGELHIETAHPAAMPLKEVAQRASFLYFTVAIYLLMAIYVFTNTSLPARRPCSLLFVSIALYLANMTPLQAKEFALHPLATRLFVYAAFIGVTGFPAMAHFALVFPAVKKIAEAHRQILWVPHVYAVTVLLLYFAGITAYGSAFPFLVIWVLIILSAFAHSIWTAETRIVRHITILGVAPMALVLLYFLGFVVVPNVNRAPLLDYTLLGAFSLILPFSLPFAIKSLRLYQDNVEANHRFLHEKNLITQELHDNLGNDLATINLIGEQLDLSLLSNPSRLSQLRTFLIETVQRDISHLSDFVWAIHPEGPSQDSLLERIQALSDKIASTLGIEIECPPPAFDFSMVDTFRRYHIYCMVKECVTNAIKHASPRHIRISLARLPDGITLEIQDDGKGFPENHRQGRGMMNMQKRAAQIGAHVTFDSKPGDGTRIHIRLPIAPQPQET